MAFRSNYWSCSKFADWIRGNPKLEIGSLEEWKDWRFNSRKSHPIRFWIAEEGLSHIEDLVYYIPNKLSDANSYFRNRWVYNTHRLTAHPNNLKPGHWCDLGDRILPCLFNGLVEFVEVEAAKINCIHDSNAREDFQPPRFNFFGLKKWRCPEAGLDYLRWASMLDDEFSKKQAKAAKEIIELYTWWTVTYPNRPDPNEASGWTKFCELRREQNKDQEDFLFQDLDPKLTKMRDKSIKLLDKIEKEYKKEDEEMMIRLIKIRDSLWI